MKHAYLIGLFSLSCITANAQSNTVSGGGTASGSNGSVTYTIGQIDYSNSSGSNGSYNQGVQQPYEFFRDVGIEENDGISLSLYPNPTQDYIHLNIAELSSDLSYELFDMKGKVLIANEIKENQTMIDLSILSSAEYHLIIRSKNEKIDAFKIIKH